MVMLIMSAPTTSDLTIWVNGNGAPFVHNQAVIVTAGYDLNWDQAGFTVAVWDDKGTRLLEKKWNKPDTMDGHVTWKVPGDIFTKKDPIYYIQAVYKGLKAHVQIMHY